MSTKRDQTYLVSGYLRQQAIAVPLPEELSLLTSHFFNTWFPWPIIQHTNTKRNTKAIYYGNDYKFQCKMNKQQVTLCMTRMPSKIAYVAIYYEFKLLNCQEIAFQWNSVALLRHGQKIPLAEGYTLPTLAHSSKDYTLYLYITILREQLRSSSRGRTIRNVTINYSDRFQWTPNRKRMHAFMDKCKQETNGNLVRLRLSLLLLPSKGANVTDAVRAVGMNCDVDMNAMSVFAFKDSKCTIFGYGDWLDLWSVSCVDVVDMDGLEIDVELELCKVYGLRGREAIGRQWYRYGVISDI
eukprot:1052547_1